MSNIINLVDSKSNVCSHCEMKYEFISEFMGYLTQLQSETGELTKEQLTEELEFFYDEAYQNGERNAYGKIGAFAEYNYNQTYQVDDEDEDE